MASYGAGYMATYAYLEGLGVTMSKTDAAKKEVLNEYGLSMDISNGGMNAQFSTTGDDKSGISNPICLRLSQVAKKTETITKIRLVLVNCYGCALSDTILTLTYGYSGYFAFKCQYQTESNSNWTDYASYVEVPPPSGLTLITSEYSSLYGGYIYSFNTTVSPSYMPMTYSYGGKSFTVYVCRGAATSTASISTSGWSTKYNGSCTWNGMSGCTMLYSTSNKGSANSYSTLTIAIKGCPNFFIGIGSYAESTYDYTVAFNIDCQVNGSPPSTTSSNVSATSSGSLMTATPSSSVSSGFQTIRYYNDGGSHTIYVVYRKDGSANVGDDCGYVIIPPQSKCT